MMSRHALDELLRWVPRSDSPVLSVYLGTDPSRAVNLRRAYDARLLDMLRTPGRRCERCGAFSPETRTERPYCGGPVSSVEDLIDAVARRVLDAGGKVEVVRDEAARRLTAAGSLGAQLRF